MAPTWCHRVNSSASICSVHVSGGISKAGRPWARLWRWAFNSAGFIWNPVRKVRILSSSVPNYKTQTASESLESVKFTAWSHNNGLVFCLVCAYVRAHGLYAHLAALPSVVILICVRNCCFSSLSLFSHRETDRSGKSMPTVPTWGGILPSSYSGRNHTAWLVAVMQERREEGPGRAHRKWRPSPCLMSLLWLWSAASCQFAQHSVAAHLPSRQRLKPPVKVCAWLGPPPPRWHGASSLSAPPSARSGPGRALLCSFSTS